jgi:signal transduction histidine kinase
VRGGFRRRLVVSFVALVALTAILLGLGSYFLVSYSLSQRLIAESSQRANFNVSVLAAGQLPQRPTRADFERSGLLDAFQLRESAESVVDFGDGDPFISSLRFRDVPSLISNELRGIVASGQLGYQWLHVDGEPFLMMGGRLPPAGPDFYFLYSAQPIENALSGLRQALIAGAVIAAVLAALIGGLLARQVLRPVRDASLAARRIEEGDMTARVPVSSNDEFGTWAASFNRMATALEEKITELQEVQQRQRRFVSDVSHELRTPLTALVNEAALLKEHLDGGRLEGLSPEGRRVGEMLVTDVRRLRRLVDDLLEISRLDAAAEETTMSHFDLGAFLRAVVAARAPNARLELPTEQLFVWSDRRHLERIVGNLLDNAREHAGGAQIEVSAGRAGDEALVDIADRGPGVAPEALARIFDRFYKADPSRRGGSSGLGLAIARENARLLGGSLEARLRGGGGLVFQLQLPVTAPLPSGDPDVTAPGEGFERPAEQPDFSREPRP